MHAHVKCRVSCPRLVSEREVPCQPAETRLIIAGCNAMPGCPAQPATFKGEPFANKVSNIALFSAQR